MQMVTFSTAQSFSVIYREPLAVFQTDATLKSWIFNAAKSLLFVAGTTSE
jgi:hypothetical protein